MFGKGNQFVFLKKQIYNPFNIPQIFIEGLPFARSLLRPRDPVVSRIYADLSWSPRSYKRESRIFFMSFLSYNAIYTLTAYN